MNSPEASLSSGQEASSSSHQSYQQGSASSAPREQAEAHVHSSESAYDSDVQFMGEASTQEASQVDHSTGEQSPRRSAESPHVFETSNQEPRGRRQPRGRRDREGSPAHRFEDRNYDWDRSRSPPRDRRCSGSARSYRSGDQRRHSQGSKSGDDFSGTNRSMHQLLLRLLFERTVDVVPYFDGEKLRVIPKGYKAAFNQKSDVLTPMGTKWK